MSEPWMNRKTGNGSPMVGRAAVVADRFELAEQLAGLRKRCIRRWIEPAQFQGIGDAGNRELESERREIRLENFRLSSWQELGLFDFRPETIAGAGSASSGSPTTLLCRGAIHPNRLESCESGSWRESRHARKPAVDDNPHTFDR
jgi:hypothetical protein